MNFKTSKKPSNFVDEGLFKGKYNPNLSAFFNDNFFK